MIFNAQFKFAAALLLAASASAHVIFHKSIDAPALARDTPVTVLLKVYNLGAEDIHDVQVQDKWPKEHFEIEGNLTHKFESIEAGSNATHSFVVTVRF